MRLYSKQLPKWYALFAFGLLFLSVVNAPISMAQATEGNLVFEVAPKSDSVNARINISNAKKDTPYGPLAITLNSIGIVDGSFVNTTPLTIDPITAKSDGSLTLIGKFDNVAQGSQYQICIAQPYNICSSKFTKTELTENVNINLSDEQSELIFSNTSTSKTSCAIEGVGWILCPIMNVMGKMVDGAYWFVEQLLITPAVNTNINDQNNGTYQAWSIMRSFANIAFVIAFLIIIFSQLTNVGINNYGIKKMLPRLIIAAILVNISYYVCAIAVDLSNIIGSSTKGLFDNITTQITATDGKDNFSWISVVALAIGGGLVYTGGFTLYGALLLLLPALISALFAIFAVFLVLTLRQALIILLIVISPLAFVAFLLPNTSVLFNKWLDLFKTMLLMFPIIAVIFGASALASKVIMGSSDSFPVQLMGALVAIIPLAITPVVMKSAGNILNKFGAIVNNPNKGIFDNMKNAVEREKAREANRTNNAAMNSKGGIFSRNAGRRAFLRYGARKNAIDENQKREQTRATTEYIANSTQGNQTSFASNVINKATGGRIAGKGFADKMAAGGNEGAKERALASAETTLSQLRTQEVNAASTILQASLSQVRSPSGYVNEKGIKYTNTDDYLDYVARNGTSTQSEAAINELARTGRDKVLRNMLGEKFEEVNGVKVNVNAKIDQSSLQAYITSNAGALAAKAPDLVKGNLSAAFDNVTGNMLTNFTPDTARAYVEYISSIQDADKQAYAIKSFNSAMRDIKENPSLQAAFGGDVGAKIIETAKKVATDKNDTSFLEKLDINVISESDGKIRSNGYSSEQRLNIKRDSQEPENKDDVKYEYFDSKDDPNSPNYKGR